MMPPKIISLAFQPSRVRRDPGRPKIVWIGTTSDVKFAAEDDEFVG